jgi:hypothetical protein
MVMQLEVDDYDGMRMRLGPTVAEVADASTY